MTTETVRFTDLALSEPVLKAIADVGYEQPSPIQAESIPHLLNGDDLLGLAQTGTGKTAAFALPLLTRVDMKLKTPQILVLAPTRELAIQVSEAFQTYAKHMKGFHVLPIYGGQSFDTQLRGLRRGVHVIVGTPGRVMDHLRRKTLDISNLKALVLDEADEMLRMGFIDDVEWILEHTPKERQTALFSATMPKEIRRVTKRYQRDPKEVSIASETRTGENIEQRYWMVSGTNKLDALTRILEVENTDAMIIFVRTKNATVELAEKLEARGYAAAALNGDMNQQLRERTIERLKNGKLDIVVATDVAARGIDVVRVSHVLNYDIPYDSEAYVHRIGRTGRAGRSGTAILFVAPREKRLLHTIENSTKQKLSRMELPSGEMVTQQRTDQFKQTLLDTIAKTKELEFFDEMLASFSHDHNVSPEQIASALALLAQKERPLQVEFKNVKAYNERDDRSSRSDRPERGNRGERGGERGGRNRSSEVESGMQRYRIEVGREHECRPGDIVGAIANEANIDSKNIGHIKLNDSFSTVDLPEGMPKEMFQTLRNVRVRGQKINITLAQESDSKGEAPKRGADFKKKPRGDFKKKRTFKKRED